MSGMPMGSPEAVKRFIEGVQRTSATQNAAWGVDAAIYRGSTKLTITEFAEKLAPLARLNRFQAKRVAMILSDTCMLSFAADSQKLNKVES